MKGSVRKRGDTWYYRINLGIVGGKRKGIERSAGNSKKEALAAMRQAIIELEQSGQHFEPSDMPLADYMDFWLTDYVETNLKHYTYISYRNVIKNHLKPALGNFKLKNITPAIVQRFINGKKRDGLSKSTVKIIHAVLKKALKHAIHPYGYLKINPMENINMPRFVIDNESIVSFTPEQMQIIFERFSVPHILYMPIVISYYTGMRVGECLALQWKNTDMTNRVIHVQNTLYDRDKDNIHLSPVKTKSSIRDIKFSNKLYLALKAQKKWQSENKLIAGPFYTKSDFICTHPNGEVLTSSNIQYFNLFCRETFGGGLSFHSLRHTHATLLIENSGDIKSISVRLGHSSIKTTLDTYIHVTPKMEDENLQIIDENFI